MTGLGPEQRAAALDRLAAEELDVLVVGAGVTGAGCALDAQTRGLATGLIEARDFASGTSSRSTKLFHGGLRYLEQFDFRLVFEALRERSLALNRLSPHLARPVPFLYPLQRAAIDRAYAGLGIGVYDVMGAGRGVPHHLRHLGRSSTARLFPDLHPEAVRGAILFYEGQVDDARHTMMISRTAAHYGAAVASSTRLTGFLRDGDQVTGVRARDLESGRELTIRARHTINATGVWADGLQQLLGGPAPFRVRASKGVHLVVPRDRIDARCGLITRTATSLLFVVPWSGHWLIGTTDTDWHLDLAHPAASSADIDYLLAQVNRLLGRPLTRDDVVGVYAGLRPLLAGESDSTSKLSREHAVASPAPGLTVVAGGKYTTYRVMAADAVDAAARALPSPSATRESGQRRQLLSRIRVTSDQFPREGNREQRPARGQLNGRAITPSCTAEIPLLGAEGFPALRNATSALVTQTGWDAATIDRLLGRYGSLLPELIAAAEAEPELRAPLHAAPEYLAVEVRYAATHEGALHLDDVLARRTRISIETPDRGVYAAPEVAQLVAPVLGWSPDTVAREVHHYRSRVRAERESQEQPDDLSADAARLGAPDVRMDGRLA